ncbi:hypothetical protein BD414DRAFT_283700 [Trametes punicea]|nr:hypothetical protein BD414DRAFT_283700 [Trametes punicea]
MSRRMRRRHTEGDTRTSSNDSRSLLPTPAPPRKIFRHLTVIFRSGRRKTGLSRYPTDNYSEESACSSESQASSSSVEGGESIAEEALSNQNRVERVPSIYEDAVEIRVSSVASAILSAATSSARVPTPSKGLEKAHDSADPAYAALMPILCELDALAEHPNCKAIAAQHNDEDYQQFWETFSQLSAKDVLCAVYAIRAGALEIPDVSDDSVGFPRAFIVCALWALLASGLALYLYFRAV